MGLINPTNIAAYFLGMLTTALVYGWILPDSWAIWLAQRKNAPWFTLPLGALLLVIGFGNLAVAVVDILLTYSFEWWVWAAIVAGGAITTICIILLRRRSKSS